MDLHMPNCDGVEDAARIKLEMPDVSILVLTISEKEEDLFNAIRAGARGYLLKEEEPEHVAEAVLQVARGGVVFSAGMADNLLNDFKGHTQASAPAEEDSGLSQREQEVLQLVALGTSNKEIGDKLFISENTVKTHLRHILDKLHLANRSQAAAYAARAGMITDPRQENN
jgi:DNA-binding NarL/FixJ family response regulator